MAISRKSCIATDRSRKTPMSNLAIKDQGQKKPGAGEYAGLGTANTHDKGDTT